MAKYTFDLTLRARPQQGIPEEEWTETDIEVEGLTYQEAELNAKKAFLVITDTEEKFLPLIQVIRYEKIS